MLTTTAAAALLNARKAEQGEQRHYTGKHIARMCKSGKIAGQKVGRDWLTTVESVEAYAAAPRDRGGRPRKEERFVASKCDRCGRATPARQNNLGDLFTLPEEFGDPLMDQGDFCAPCCEQYDRDDWIAWLRQHRPEIFE